MIKSYRLTFNSYGAHTHTHRAGDMRLVRVLNRIYRAAIINSEGPLTTWCLPQLSPGSDYRTAVAVTNTERGDASSECEYGRRQHIGVTELRLSVSVHSLSTAYSPAGIPSVRSKLETVLKSKSVSTRPYRHFEISVARPWGEFFVP